MRTKKEISLPEKLEKQMQERQVLLKKRDALGEKIILIEKQIKKTEEEIENLKVDTTIKLIKGKGYTLDFINDIIKSGTLDRLIESPETIENETVNI